MKTVGPTDLSDKFSQGLTILKLTPVRFVQNTVAIYKHVPMTWNCSISSKWVVIRRIPLNRIERLSIMYADMRTNASGCQQLVAEM